MKSLSQEEAIAMQMRKGKPMDEITNEILSNPHDELSIAKNLVSNYSPQVLEIALKYAIHLVAYGIDIAEKHETVVQQEEMCSRAYTKGRYDEREAKRCIDCEAFNKSQLLVPQSEQKRWIPVKWKPLDDKSRKEWEDALGYLLTDEEAMEADCKMPHDCEEIWICTKSGIVCEDIAYNENGMICLEDGDIMDIVAWMPRTAPEPYKESENG